MRPTARNAPAANEAAMPDLADLYPGFASHWIDTSAGRIFARTGGSGPPLMLLHGYAQTNVMWHRVAPALGQHFSLVIPDLPGYGWSAVPEAAKDHSPYTKRAMAAAMIEVMEQLGHARFSLAGHDRGGRVSYRLALDHPEKVQRLAVLDVIPISEGWGHADSKFAMTYWPWILLSQKAPLPEKYLLGAPDAVFDNPFGQGSFGEEIKSEYLETYRDPERVHAICEEYRAAASIDIEHDKKDVADGRKISCPMLHLWAEGGPLDTFYGRDGGALGIWRKWADNLQGQSMKGGHFFPEENPEQTIEILRKFLAT
jgi:haloacetate dehalogenase